MVAFFPPPRFHGTNHQNHLSAAALAAQDKAMHADFAQFAADYDKSYSVEEVFSRFENFRANSLMIKEHNAKGLA